MERRVAIAAFALTLAACGRQEAPKVVDPATKVEQAATQMGRAARQGDVEQVGEAMKQMGKALSRSVDVEPVDFRKLKEVLPESIAGLKRTGSEGSRTNVMGIASSSAEATYEDGRGARAVLDIRDAGTFNGITAMAFAWLDVDIDKEGTSGYERTTNVGGRKAYERYDRSARTGDLDMIVGGRFVVSLKATGVEMKAFRAAVTKLDLVKLEALRLEGLAPAPPVAAR